MRAIHSLSVVISFVALAFCASIKEPNSNVGDQPSQQTSVFCEGKNLTEYSCPPATDSRDVLCQVICLLATQLPTSRQLPTASLGQTFQCPINLSDKPVSLSNVKPDIQPILNILKAQVNCSTFCEKEPVKCKSITQLAQAYMAPPNGAVSASDSKPAQDVHQPPPPPNKPIENPAPLGVMPNGEIVKSQSEPNSAVSVATNEKKEAQSSISNSGPSAQQDSKQPVKEKPVKEPEAPAPVVSNPAQPEVRQEQSKIDTSPAANNEEVNPPSNNLNKGDLSVGAGKEQQEELSDTNDNEDDDAPLDTEDEAQNPLPEQPDVELEPEVNLVHSKPIPEVSPQISHTQFVEAEDSHFFIYFLTFTCLTIIGYIAFHNKNKILALALEGRRGDRSNRRRPNTAKYQQLDPTLEEAISSNPSRAPVSHVAY